MASSRIVSKTLALVFMGIMIASLAGPVLAYELTSGTTTISNGDPVTLRGIATGHPRNGLQVWVISKNYLDISTIMVNDDNTFEFELRPADTISLAPGQYFVVVQHPMMNGVFDIYYDPSSGTVIDRQMGTGGSSIFTMSGAGSLQGPASAQALVNAISSQNVDDSFTTYTFTIVPPGAFIDPIADHVAGDRFTITGSTNLAVGDRLMVDITSSSFKPTQKSVSGEYSGTSGMVTVVPGSGGYNRWSFDVDTTAFQPDEYIVTVSGITIDVTGSTTFNVVEQVPTAIATTQPAPVPTTAVPATTATPAPAAPTTTAKSPLPLVLAVLGLAAAAALKRG